MFGFGSGGSGNSPRARSIAATVASANGLLVTVSRFGLLSPATWAKTGGHANLTINASTGGISATSALAVGASQSLAGTVTGADGVVIPFTANLTAAISTPTPTPTPAPGNTVLPAITGTAQEGQTLTVSNGTWTGSPTSYARQWRRNGTAISGATGTTRLLASADVGTVITCTVTATNAGGSTAATSAGTATVAAAADSTAPTLSSPTGAQTGATTASLGVTSNEANGTLYWAVLPTASAAPSTTAFIAGATGGVATGSTNSPLAGANSFSATGLAASTGYRAHFFQRDAAGNNSGVVSTATFTTAAAADSTAPTLSSPVDNANGSTGASLSVSTNEGNGTLYWFVSTSATPPTATALKAGTGAVASGTQAVSSTGVKTINVTGLTASTAYYAHFLHRDAAGNDSAIVSGNGFTTAAATPALTLTPTSQSGFDNMVPGATVFDASNVPTGVTATISPNDGRFVIAGTGATTKVVRGLSNIGTGTVALTVSAAGATSIAGNVALTASAPASRQRPAVKTPPAITGTTYYVAANGNDSANGTTTGTAWQTLAKVRSVINTLAAGDAILLRGGDVFTDTVPIAVTTSGTFAARKTLGSYGTGKATIRLTSAGADAVSFKNCSYWSIRDLIFDGNNSCAQGLFVGAITSSCGNFDTINCEGINATGVGILFGSDSNSYNISNVNISGCVGRNCNTGIATYEASGGYADRANHHCLNIQIDNCTAYDNVWSGIILGGAMNSAIVWSVAYNNGAGQDAGGGIWVYDSTDCFIRFCEAYLNKTSGTSDGYGLDLDGGCYQCGIENSYSHDNHGPGILLCSYANDGATTDSYVRNNVMVNNCTKGNANYGDMHIGASGQPLTDVYVHNNTILTNATGTGAAGIHRGGNFTGEGTITNLVIANNVVHAVGASARLVNLRNATGTIFRGNLYSGTFRWQDVSTARTTLGAWQTAREATATTEAWAQAPATAQTYGGFDSADLQGLFGSLSTSTARNGGVVLSSAGVTAPSTDAFGSIYLAQSQGAGEAPNTLLGAAVVGEPTLDATLPTPVVTFTNPGAYPPAAEALFVGPLWAGQDVLQYRRATSLPALTGATVQAIAIPTSGPVSIGLTGIASGVTLLQARLGYGNTYGPWSEVALHGAVAPAVTGSTSFSAVENQDTLCTLTTDQTCTLLLGGTDGGLLTVTSGAGTGHVVKLASGVLDYDADTNGKRNWSFTATPVSSPAGIPGPAQAIAVTVTNVTSDDPPGLETVYTEDFQSGWASRSLAVGPGPIANSVADKIIENNGNTAHYYFTDDVPDYEVGPVTLLPYYLKADERNFAFVQITTADGFQRYSGIVNLTTGAVTDLVNTGSATGANIQTVSAGNGWWAVTLSMDHIAPSLRTKVGISNSATPAAYPADFGPTYQGDGVSGILVGRTETP